MREELDRKLFNKHINLFPEGKNVDPNKNLMYYGFCCNDGWYDILDELFTDLKKMMINNIPITISQIKEKFGTLSIYIENIPNEIYKQVSDRIIEAEHQSCFTCENCGESGIRRTDLAWIRTLCDTCYDEHKKDREELGVDC